MPTARAVESGIGTISTAIAPDSRFNVSAMIRPAAVGDADAIARIYNHYVLDTVVTCEERAVPVAEMGERIAEVLAAQMPWLVAESEGHVAGYAYASQWRTRSAYRYSAEVSVYLDPAAVGAGHGTRLYAALFPLLRERGFHAAMAGIALPAPASVALHEKFGMRQVAHFREVGFKFGRWIDVGYWQVLLQSGPQASPPG